MYGKRNKLPVFLDNFINVLRFPGRGRVRSNT